MARCWLVWEPSFRSIHALLQRGAVVNRTKRQPVPAKRAHIVDVAMRHFAEHGYEDARTEDIAREAGIAKGAVFQHFGNKQGLFLAAYKRAAGSFFPYLDAPPEIRTKGFWEVLRYWLARRSSGTGKLAAVPGRVVGQLRYWTPFEAGYQSLSGGGGSIRNRGLCAPGIEGRRAARGCR